MFGSNVSNGGGSIAATPSLMGLLSQQQNADQLTQQDQSRQLGFDYANDPLKLAHSGLTNDTLAAELPGVVAGSNIRQRADRVGGATEASDIADILGKHGSEKVKRQVAEMENLGQVAMQQAQAAMFNPLGAAQRAKQAFKDAGHEDMWDPSWDSQDTSDPRDFAFKLNQFGNGIQQTNSAFNKQMAGLESKANASATVAQINAQAKTDAANILAQSRRDVQAAKAKAGTSKESWENLAVGLKKAAMEATDPEQIKMFLKESEDAQEHSKTLKAAGAAVRVDADVNIDALGHGKLESNANARKAPAAGVVEDGHRFKGGNPADPKNWEKI